MSIYTLILLVFLLRILGLLCSRFFPIFGEKYKPTWVQVWESASETALTLGFLALLTYQGWATTL
jgi:Na+-transporting methylmalonyl-CoA/oxaloacetate decarboxylase gamma subunit